VVKCYPEFVNSDPMHELSLALNILEITEDSVKANKVSRVDEIVLEVGILAGVEISALETALDSIRQGTILEKSKIIINIIPGMAICRNCKHEFEPDTIYCICPNCDHYGSDLISGGELKVKTIIAE
jgi:hydrogenase nickel incorporation protein HypA/HybF